VWIYIYIFVYICTAYICIFVCKHTCMCVCIARLCIYNLTTAYIGRGGGQREGGNTKLDYFAYHYYF